MVSRTTTANWLTRPAVTRRISGDIAVNVRRTPADQRPADPAASKPGHCALTGNDPSTALHRRCLE